MLQGILFFKGTKLKATVKAQTLIVQGSKIDDMIGVLSGLTPQAALVGRV